MQPTRHAHLTRMEKQVVAALIDGRSPKEVARALGLQLSTVRTYVRQAHRKNDTHSLTSLVLWGLEHHECCLTVPAEEREAR